MFILSGSFQTSIALYTGYMSINWILQFVSLIVALCIVILSLQTPLLIARYLSLSIRRF